MALYSLSITSVIHNISWGVLFTQHTFLTYYLHFIDNLIVVTQTVKYLQCRRPGFYPWVGKIPWRGAWQPIPVFLPGESPWTEEPGGLQSMWSQRVWHDRVTKHNNQWIQFSSKGVFKPININLRTLSCGHPTGLILHTFSPKSFWNQRLVSWKTIFPQTGVGEMVSAWFKCLTLIVHFFYIILISALPQIIRY